MHTTSEGTGMKLTQRAGSHFRETPDGLLLLATRASGDAVPQFPPMAFVHRGAHVEEVPIGPLGVLYTYSIVHPGREKRPYGLAMVDFAPGVRVFGPMHFELGAEPPLGSPMKIVPHTMADGAIDYAFEALQGASA